MPKLHVCRNCGIKYQKSVSTQTVCGFKCAIEYSKTVVEKKRAFDARMREKAARLDLRQKKESLKSRSQWMKEAQQAFNAYIRARDEFEPCISCDKQPTNQRRYLHATGGYWDSGHYRSTGSMPALRFCELNAHKQCKQCNRDLSGNIVEYRLRLAARITPEQLAWLEGPHEARKYTIQELKAIKLEYKRKLKDLVKKNISLD